MNWKRLFTSPNPFQPAPLQAALSYLILGFWAFVVLFPIYWLITTAFKLPVDVSTGPKYIPFVDFQPTLQAWQEMLDGELQALGPFRNTLIVGVISAAVALLIGSLAAYALIRFQYRPKPALVGMFMLCVLGALIAITNGVPWQLAFVGALVLFIVLAQTIGRRFKGTLKNEDIAFWLISQRMLPPIAVIIPIYVLFQQLGLLNTHAALIIAYATVNIPLVIWFMRDYFESIPLELEESAFIDGASRYQVLWRIILPLSMPGLVATFLIVLVFTWNEYLMALFLTGANTQTMPMLIVGQNATRGPQWWNISVLVLIMVGPLLVMAVILERYIAKGLLIGAVKG